MSEFNQELIRALANGDKEAHQQIQTLPAAVRMGLGLAVDKMRQDENIVPMSNGFSVFEKQKSTYVDDDAIREAMQRKMDIDRENREKQEAAREAFIQEQTRLAVDRARSGLPRNDQLPR